MEFRESKVRGQSRYATIPISFLNDSKWSMGVTRGEWAGNFQIQEETSGSRIALSVAVAMHRRARSDPPILVFEKLRRSNRSPKGVQDILKGSLNIEQKVPVLHADVVDRFQAAEFSKQPKIAEALVAGAQAEVREEGRLDADEWKIDSIHPEAIVFETGVGRSGAMNYQVQITIHGVLNPKGILGRQPGEVLQSIEKTREANFRTMNKNSQKESGKAEWFDDTPSQPRVQVPSQEAGILFDLLGQIRGGRAASPPRLRNEKGRFLSTRKSPNRPRNEKGRFLSLGSNTRNTNKNKNWSRLRNTTRRGGRVRRV